MTHGKYAPAVKRIVSLALAVIICVGSVIFSGGDSVKAASDLTDATVQKYEEQLEALAAKQKEIQNQLASLRNQQASWQQEKAAIDSYLNTTERKMEAAEILFGELQAQIDVTRAEIEAVRHEYNSSYQYFLDYVALSYEDADVSYLSLILGAESLSDFLSRVDQVSSILDYKKTVIEKLDATRVDLEAREAQLNAKLQIQSDTIAQLQLDRAAYQKEADAAIARLAVLEQNESVALANLRANQAEEEKLDKELEAYLVELQRKNQLQLQAGEWMWPIPMSAQQYCSSVYGWRKLWGAWDFHRGWDIACWLGTDIMASKAGTVVISTFHNSYGNYVVIDHGGGISTVYAHASKLLVAVGDKVERGQVIAKVGTTGSSTGYHLHFEFRKNGKYTDPFEFIPKPPISVGASRYNKW
ncbi:MAG: peptidoglycan DD-metalloendopeptidase family protein [Clostridia bacterium]|nr:peptidoglycan DD-metalloendopeptidase family protein [Clostridia bacterium]